MDLAHTPQTREHLRLHENQGRTEHWNRWGPYLSERAWGTVREDYSPFGTAWDYFPHDHARSRAYRWNEDGLAGICDRHQHICFAIALWNGRDPILKERLFGLSNGEGNHGEDVKEYYFYLDNTPTHAYMKYLYKYPQAAFPYANLVEENRRRNRTQPEYELLDTGVFEGNRYFDVFVEYTKATPEDILIEITVENRGPEPASLEVLPTIWFRNTWSWDSTQSKPRLQRGDDSDGRPVVELNDAYYGRRYLYCQAPAQLLFTENDTNFQRVFGVPNATPYVKDAFHELVVHGRQEAVNPAQHGTKAAARYRLQVGAGQAARVRLRLGDRRWAATDDPFGAEFDATLAGRRREADEFYATIIPDELSVDAKNVMRQALAGLLWSKQFYHYELKRWLDGDPSQPPPPSARLHGRNHDWTHLYNADVISMPDKWEFPWYASWDLAFHCVTLALVDPELAKAQLTLMLREWYMHPNGQIPAYEWAFDDVNPPVHAWAALRVYQIERRRCRVGDCVFLERIFHKLLLNFTWWVNRKDALGTNIFQGGFLGLDNIGLFDRSQTILPGMIIGQSDGTSWMAMYCLNLLAIALELATHDPVYEDVASKFWEHFLYIANAIHQRGDGKISLWDEEDGFFYDVVRLPDGEQQPIKIRSMVGLIPLLAVTDAPAAALERFPGFKRRMAWFMANRPELTGNITSMMEHGQDARFLMSVVQPQQLRRILRIMLDEQEFLSPYGIRSVSQKHREFPYVVKRFGAEYRLAYEPGEATSAVFGGNSNWRGPILCEVDQARAQGETMEKSLPEVYLARHGETAWSMTGQHTGRTDVPLTARGERNALSLGERLKGMAFATILTSPRSRARRTCELAGFGDQAEVDPDLQEWDYGQYEGRRTADIRLERPDWYLFRDGCPGGESVEAIGDRADRVVAHLRAIDGNVLLFSHGHILRVLAARWLGLPAGHARYFVLSTAALSMLGYEHSLTEPAIRLWNDDRHVVSVDEKLSEGRRRS